MNNLMQFFSLEPNMPCSVSFRVYVFPYRSNYFSYQSYQSCHYFWVPSVSLHLLQFIIYKTYIYKISLWHKKSHLRAKMTNQFTWEHTQEPLHRTWIHLCTYMGTSMHVHAHTFFCFPKTKMTANQLLKSQSSLFLANSPYSWCWEESHLGNSCLGIHFLCHVCEGFL